MRQIADEEFRGATSGPHLPTTSSLKVAYCRLTGEQNLVSDNLAHFFVLSARLVRRKLLEEAHPVDLQDKAFSQNTVTLGEHSLPTYPQPSQLPSLDDALARLGEFDPGLCQLVELCFFGGLCKEDISQILEIPTETLEQDWRLAKAWIYQQISAARTVTAPVTATEYNGPPATGGSEGTGVATAPTKERGTSCWTPEYWRTVKKAFAEAVAYPGASEKEWLTSWCAGNVQLEKDLQLLLSADQHAGNFLEVPAGSLCYPLLEEPHSLNIGETISGRFKILRFISSGGMGEVYEAWDYELQDRVALKTVRPEVASAVSVIGSFKQEVKRARGISHPNICRVYDLFSHKTATGERIWFLTMQLLQGQTLLDRIRRAGPFKPEEALPLVEQMVDGIAAAHEIDIVHRDLKSANVMLVEAEEGKQRAVIMDFGLALDLASASQVDWEPAGQGTPDYMAPEQRRDGKVGLAADQYALGIVMCEMVTGHRPSRRTQAVAGGLAVDLPTGHGLPSQWERVLRRCLQTKPEDRYPKIGDVIGALNPRLRRTRIASMSAAAVIIMTLLVGIYWPGKPRIEAASALTSETDFSMEPSISSDGKTAAYTSDRADAGNLDIWVQRLPSGAPVRITSDPAEDRSPSISPDGSAVVWRSSRNGGGIYISDLNGESERLLVPGGRNPVFSPDGRQIAFWLGDMDKTVASGQLYVLSLPAGSPVRLASDFKDARLPVWSSDGQNILFLGCRAANEAMPECSEGWITSTDGNRVQNTSAMALLRNKGIVLIDAFAGWSGNNALLTGRRGVVGGSGGKGRDLWELPMSSDGYHVSGEVQKLTETGDVDGASSLAENGTILFSRYAGALHVWRIDGSSEARTATAAKVTRDPAIDITPYISHNGRWLVFSRGIGNHHDIWIQDTRSGVESLFLASPNNKSSPIVDDSGKTVVYETKERNTPSIFKVRSGELPSLLCTGCSKPTSWFAASRGVFYRDGLPSKIKMVNPETAEAHVVLESPSASLGEASWSPESEYLLFTAAAEGGKKQAFAVNFPKITGVATGKWIPISSPAEWGDRPRWSGDGKTVFYLSNRDGFSCLWGQHFDAASGKTIGPPFAVMHYHNARLTPEEVLGDSFEISVAGNAIYLNVAEVRDTIWTGVLKHHGLLFNWRR
jgi:serine/threonine protein kinase